MDKSLEAITLTLGDHCAYLTTIFRWYKIFQRGNFNLEDAEGTVNEENITDVRKILDEDRKVLDRQIEENSGLNVPIIFSIMKDHLRETKRFCL